MDDKFRYIVDEDYDYLIEEKGNQATFLRKVSWGGRDSKLELRKYVIDGTSEKPMKGVTFMTDEGPDELVDVLVRTDYGNTESILRSIKDREDFPAAVRKVLGTDSELYNADLDNEVEEEYYDPKSLDLGMEED